MASAHYDECAQCGEELLVADLAWHHMVSDWGLILAASYCCGEAGDPMDEHGQRRSVCYRLAVEDADARAAILEHLREQQVLVGTRAAA